MKPVHIIIIAIHIPYNTGFSFLIQKEILNDTVLVFINRLTKEIGIILIISG